jgi:signal transduction histidine kinase
MDGTGGGRNNGRESDKDRLIEELREAVLARDEFVAIATHELRNPMTPILMQVDSLLSAARNPARCRPDIVGPRLEILATAVREFVRRASVLLDVSRIAAGNLQVELTEIDVSELVREVVGHAGLGARMARCRLEVDVQDGVTGVLDRLAVQQIGENLLSNAIKFGAGKPVMVSLCSDGPSARLTVRDNGIGIAEEDRQRIFGRFERAVARREHGGFGIGLWLAQNLTTAMHGTIAIEHAPGGGSVFIVTLPLDGTAQQEGTGA